MRYKKKEILLWFCIEIRMLVMYVPNLKELKIIADVFDVVLTFIHSASILVSVPL